MAKKCWPIVAMMVLFWISLVACGGVDVGNPFKTFTPSELVGTWRADYAGVEYSGTYSRIKLTGVETLTLRADGTYQQIYNDGKGYLYISPWNKWRLDSKESFLYLESGRAYYLGIEDAERTAKNPPGKAMCTYLRNERIDVDCADVIFQVLPASMATNLTDKRVVLESSELGDPDDPEYVRFYLIATPVPTATVVR